MAKEIVETVVCDITGEVAITSEKFGVSGHWYEIDLNKEWEEKYKKQFAFWMDRARRVGVEKEPANPKDKAAVQVNPIKVRQWCKIAGVKVNSHGKVPQDVVNAFLIAYTKDDFPEECR